MNKVSVWSVRIAAVTKLVLTSVCERTRHEGWVSVCGRVRNGPGPAGHGAPAVLCPVAIVPHERQGLVA